MTAGDAPTRYDARAFTRAAALACAFFVAGLGVTSLSDEGGVALGARFGRTLPAAPLCAAAAAWLTARAARARGEALALAALGRSPLALAAPHAAGGAAIGVLAAAVALASPAVDLAGLFPTVDGGATFVPTEGGFLETRDGIFVDLEGKATRGAPSGGADEPRDPGVPPGGRAAAALAVALAGLALALVAAAPREGTRLRGGRGAAGDATAAALCDAAALVLFHAAAARRVGAEATLAPSAALLAWALFRYKGPRWRPIDRR